jgi:DNA-binding response OmpR family regulator
MTDEGGPSEVRVLVVDDDEDTSYILALYLEREGWTVSRAPSVYHAKSELEREPYDVLITDLNLPDGDGLSLLEPARPRNLRAALLVTGVSDCADGQKEKSSRFDGFFVKPFDGKQMVSLIRQLLEQPADMLRVEPRN